MNGENNDTPSEEPRTVFAPQDATFVPQTQPPPVAALSPEPLSRPTSFGGGGAATPRPGEAKIQVGDVLNHIYEVRRFIARGGMGEVYEGINVNTDEPVAIKVILPALAADPNVQAMFRKEAKTLTRLSHPALVQYRVLAQDPQLGVFYIVTDFIAGTNLSDVLASAPKDPQSLFGLLRRLAEGLRAAHELKPEPIIHRDVSPDNILLEDGLFENARVIDFGIAKDLDTTKGTIIGDGFAGKLNYVAPEQLGDFAREVGPWTDVYSLALVILAAASGKNVNMGATLVDAVDKRRAGVDISAAPEPLRPVLEAMLRPNPRERLQSMAAVIGAIDITSTSVPPPAHSGTGTPQAARAPVKRDEPGSKRSPLLIGGSIAAAVVVLLGIGSFMMSGKKTAGTTPNTATNASQPAAAAPDVAATAIIAAALPAVDCSWLSVETLTASDGIAVRFGGVAGNTAAAQAAISSAITTKGLKLARMDFEDVAPINPVACSMLDAYRALKSGKSSNLTTVQVKYEMSMVEAGPDAGKIGAIPQIKIGPDLLTKDLVLVGIESDGNMSRSFSSVADLKDFVTKNPAAASINKDGTVTYSGLVTTTGWSGVLAVSGKGPIDTNLIAPPLSARGPDWQAKIAAAAKANGWKADMVWFKVVDEKPNAAPPANPAAPPAPAAH